MGAHVSRKDFEWSYTDEPHATRRKEILKKHPEIKYLMGPDWKSKWIIIGMVFFQIGSLFIVKDLSNLGLFLAAYFIGGTINHSLMLEKHPEIKYLMGPDWKSKWIIIGMVFFQIGSLFIVKDLSNLGLFLAAYFIGGTINHSLMLAIHEISHNLVFGHSHPLANRLFGLFANLPIGVPFSPAFKKYHLEHHKYQGDEKLDTDIPTKLEAVLFTRTGTKFLWLVLQPLFYALRPPVVYPKALTTLEYVCIIIQLSFDAIIIHFFGWRSLLYLLG
ncbi:unnamed protein product, partial [Darwinula stevensoni]